MKIAFVPAARVLSEHEANGEALIATTLIRRLAARGHQITAYCERSDFTCAGVDVREVSAHGATAALGRVAFARRIARDVQTLGADVHHALFPFTTDDGYSLVRGAPLVLGPVNLPWPRPKRSTPLHARATDLLEHVLHARTLARASRVLATGPSSINALAGRARVIEDVPFGVDTARFFPASFPSEKTIVACGELSERKGTRTLLDAFAYVRTCLPSARLIIAGADPDGMASEVEAAGGMYVGEFPHSCVPGLFARATVVCQPSLGEPFGMTVVEAMACGRAVVGTAAGGIPDAIIEARGGHLVTPRDPRLLAEGLLRVLGNDYAARAMGEFNRARALERYSLDVVVDRIEATYESLTTKERARATAA